MDYLFKRVLPVVGAILSSHKLTSLLGKINRWSWRFPFCFPLNQDRRKVALPKTNISPESRPKPKRKCHLPTNFQGLYWFQGG